MIVPEESDSRVRSPWPPISFGFAAGAAIGLAVHFAGLDRWAAVPIYAGIGGGVGSWVAWLLKARSIRLDP